MTRSLTRIAATSAGLLLAAVSSFLTAPPAAALVSGAQHSVATGKCLGIYGNVVADGQQAIIWDCNGNNDQRWEFTGEGNGFYQLKNANGKCLAVWAQDNSVIQWNCNHHADQQWYIDSSAGTAQLRNGAAYDKCVTISGTGNASRAYLATCNMQTNQRWY
ncbi:RICIN domain-containing protein [Streptomyces sp. NPDC057682]|uniref:RICIN domain-containing protein n=1 Tax=unclassified Streptomyces TaxID=2593676 RepID=UPI0036481701